MVAPTSDYGFGMYSRDWYFYLGHNRGRIFALSSLCTLEKLEEVYTQLLVRLFE